MKEKQQQCWAPGPGQAHYLPCRAGSPSTGSLARLSTAKLQLNCQITAWPNMSGPSLGV